MKKPDRDDKKYHYFHAKANKRMFNNEKFNRDCEAYRKFLAESEEVKQLENGNI